MIVLVATLLAASPQTHSEIRFGKLGAVHVQVPADADGRLAIVVSGRGGASTAEPIASALSSRGVITATVDLPQYERALAAAKAKCSYPAGDFEALSQFLQKKLDRPRYELPVLVGQAAGATWVYATLAQSPPNTFAGAVSVGFCREIEVSKPLCAGRALALDRSAKLPELKPAVLEAKWTVLQGARDTTCPANALKPFVEKVSGAKLTVLDRVDHRFSGTRWTEALASAFDELDPKPVPKVAPSPDAGVSPNAGRPLEDISDLPVVEVKPASPNGALAIIISGDGGWAGIDREIANALQAQGISVAGLNALQYFWKARSPDETARDVARMARHYLAAWNLSKLVLGGYSRGADVMPFVASRLPPDLRQKMALVALIAPAKAAQFEFHVTDWLSSSDQGLSVPDEIRKLAGLPVLCVFGKDDSDDSACPLVDPKTVSVLELEGAHHFNGAYGPIADEILKRVR